MFEINVLVLRFLDIMQDPVTVSSDDMDNIEWWVFSEYRPIYPITKLPSSAPFTSPLPIDVIHKSLVAPSSLLVKISPVTHAPPSQPSQRLYSADPKIRVSGPNQSPPSLVVLHLSGARHSQSKSNYWIALEIPDDVVTKMTFEQDVAPQNDASEILKDSVRHRILHRLTSTSKSLRLKNHIVDRASLSIS
ncbi:alpha-1 3-mannosyl-glycoprotein [Striga asiatica]|uniref:Alpha-1 3-mannosyl-glycoprotein n=1 Tax=Striga asiatica TaxID=4170 RepID=A0A5A7QRL9_STRAF|nr:alpha-1 3-mannosyl-glycoprotein [Striga asiatica]